MALEISKVDVWAKEIPDQPGELANLLEEIAAAGGDLQAVIGRREHEKKGMGAVFVCPVKGRVLQNAAKDAGLAPAENVATLRVDGPNKAGVGYKMMRAISDAGVNVRGVSAVVIGNKFAAYIGFDSAADASTAAKAIKAADKAPKAKTKR